MSEPADSDRFSSDIDRFRADGDRFRGVRIGSTRTAIEIARAPRFSR